MAVIDIGTILQQWEAAGIFQYLLPFLLIFAIVFGILNATAVLGKNKGIQIIIAFVIGLLSLQLNYVPLFFQELFPRLGIGLSVLLTVLILVGLFIPEEQQRYYYYGLGAIGLAIAATVILKAFDNFAWYSSAGYGQYIGWIVGALLLIGIIIAVAASGNNNQNDDAGKATYKLQREN